jgi:ankyrin repeat protein
MTRQHFFYAIQQGKTEICKLLIAAGADVNTQNHLGITALFIATTEINHRGADDECFERLHEICELLVMNGADVLAADGRGRTPLNYCSESFAQHLKKLYEERKEALSTFKRAANTVEAGDEDDDEEDEEEEEEHDVDDSDKGGDDKDNKGKCRY